MTKSESESPAKAIVASITPSEIAEFIIIFFGVSFIFLPSTLPSFILFI